MNNMEMFMFQKDTNSGTANNSLSSSYHELENKDRCAMCYNHTTGIAELTTLKEAFTLTPGPQFLASNYTKRVGLDTLQAQNSANPDQLVIERKVYEEEINNNLSRGYLPSEEQREFVSKIRKISISSSTNIISSSVYSDNDYRTILAAQGNGTAFISDYHEAAIAIENNVSFVFVLSDEQNKLSADDFKTLFFKKTNNVRREIKRLKNKYK